MTREPTQTHAPSPHTATPCSLYTYDELAAIYNQTRIDYIVPMPMNGKRLKEYCDYYDIQLDASVVSLDGEHEPNGIGMLGVRGDRAWITRLGVIPDRRGRRLGQFLLEYLLEQAQRVGARDIQLEVIKGNDPALNLFLKFGFAPMGEILVIRRPPSKLSENLAVPPYTALPIEPDTIPDKLAQREPYASWIGETASMLNAGSLDGFDVTLADGERGWVVFCQTPFQISHIVLSANASPDMMLALLYHVHATNPIRDTKVENVPIDHPSWAQFQKLGYVEAFTRIEMLLTHT